MVTGQLTRSEAEAALKRLQGLRDDWAKQRTRWSEHHQKALDIKNLQRNPSAPLVYTVEACCNQMGRDLSKILDRVHSTLSIYLYPKDPMARSDLPYLIYGVFLMPHPEPAVALPGQVAGFSAENMSAHSLHGIGDQINVTHHNNYPYQQQQQQPYQQQQQLTGVQTGGFYHPNNYLQPQQQQQLEQARVNQFSNNVFQNSHHHQQQQQPTYSNQHQLQSSPLNPFNPNPPHGAVLDASQRYPAVQ
ncbi:hypothetical protein PSHT_08686 [Puccinia striiformis]|uniref:Uncharacterized protein n=1 Tax=Puccinia striiformis TaxID=27350 RepID=A0A2S4VM53_9BASI|nr:hypothetical protein PSHT_08686 [Puccinia striiformis]